MKLQILSCSAFLALAQAANYEQVGVYLEKNFNWGGMSDSLQQALNAGYNRFYVGFYMSQHGCQGACQDWANLTQNQRNSIKSLLASYNAQLYLSVGGPGEYWEGCINSNCAQSFASSAAAHASQYGYDGVEIAMKLAGEGTVPSPYADNGSFAGTAKSMVAAMSPFGASNIAISSNAPYFSPEFVGNNIYNSLASLCLDSNEGTNYAVGECNLLMFNEDGNYMTENDIFYENEFYDPIYGVFGAGSAVKQVVDLGISANKVGIIKPISADESTVRSGYVSPSTLGNWACNAQFNFGWTGGVIGWTWNSSTEEELEKVVGFANVWQNTCNATIAGNV